MSVLILTRQLDPTADLVVRELASREVRVFRCDVAEFPEALSFTARFDGQWRGVLRTADRQIALEEIRSVYYRRPTRFRFAEGMTQQEQEWAAREARMGFGGVIASLSCRWLNHPHRIAAAEYKPCQLAVAASVGLRVPATLVTNDPRNARSFAEGFEAGVVYKSLSGSPSPVDGRSLALYTTLVDRQDCSHPGLARTAHLFQEWVPKAYEVRMTVVGDQVFAARIDAGSSSARVDWRSDYRSLHYTVEAVPDHIRSCSLELLRRLGLSFGALDFVVTPEKEWVFLEVNPNGQWGWVEHATSLPITAGIADFLQEIAR